VTLINLDEGTLLAGLEKVAEADADGALDNASEDTENDIAVQDGSDAAEGEAGGEDAVE
jgi:hypothetical protein